jgi:hypothetical protein
MLQPSMRQSSVPHLSSEFVQCEPHAHVLRTFQRRGNVSESPFFSGSEIISTSAFTARSAAAPLQSLFAAIASKSSLLFMVVSRFPTVNRGTIIKCKELEVWHYPDRILVLQEDGTDPFPACQSIMLQKKDAARADPALLSAYWPARPGSDGPGAQAPLG